MVTVKAIHQDLENERKNNILCTKISSFCADKGVENFSADIFQQIRYNTLSPDEYQRLIFTPARTKLTK